MAKRRVHEIAKERGISSKEVIAILQKAGLDVKTAAQSVDEGDIARAFNPGAQTNGAGDGAGGERGSAAQGGAAAAGDGQGGDGAAKPQRPQRAAPPANVAGGGRRRRVVIDSQASRRPSGPAPQQQAPRRGRGRRRRTPWVEPDLNAPAPPVEEAPPAQIASGATVKEVAESLGLSAAEVIKKLMQLGEMATLTQTLSEEAIVTLAEEFD